MTPQVRAAVACTSPFCGPRTGVHLPLVTALLLAALVPGAAGAFRLQAEEYASGGSRHDEGGNRIGTVSCDAASGGTAVEGFDTAGDWIRIPFAVSETMFFMDSVRTARAAGNPPAALLFEVRSRLDPMLVVAYDVLVTGTGQGFG